MVVWSKKTSAQALWLGALCCTISCAPSEKKMLKLPEAPTGRGQWTRSVDTRARDLRLDVLEDRVIVHGTGTDSTTRSNAYFVTALEATKGTPLWSRVLALPHTQPEGVTTTVRGRSLLIASARDVYLVDLRNNREPLHIQGSEECVLRASYIPTEEALLVDRCDQTLDLYDTASGTRTGTYETPLWTTFDVVQSERYGLLVFATDLHAKDSDHPDLAAFALRQTTPKKRAALPEALWKVKIRPDTASLRMVGSVVVLPVSSVDDETHAVDIDTGARLWKINAAEEDGSLRSTDRWIVYDSLRYPGDSSVLPGRVRQLRAYPPHRGPKGRPVWQTVVPSGFEVLGFDSIGERAERLFTATHDQLLVLDHATGRVLWGYALDVDSEQGRWVAASANTKAAYLLMRRGVLKRIPIEYE